MIRSTIEHSPEEILRSTNQSPVMAEIILGVPRLSIFGFGDESECYAAWRATQPITRARLDLLSPLAMKEFEIVRRWLEARPDRNCLIGTRASQLAIDIARIAGQIGLGVVIAALIAEGYSVDQIGASTDGRVVGWSCAQTATPPSHSGPNGSGPVPAGGGGASNR